MQLKFREPFIGSWLRIADSLRFAIIGANVSKKLLLKGKRVCIGHKGIIFMKKKILLHGHTLSYTSCNIVFHCTVRRDKCKYHVQYTLWLSRPEERVTRL
jgi:hypothetical protein